MKKLILILLVAVVSFISLHAEVYIKSESKTPEIMGQPAKDTIQEQWLGKNKLATVSEGTSMILNLDEKKMYIIMHKTKTYVVADTPVDYSKLVPEQMAAMFKNMMDSSTITVTPNNQTKQVGKWKTSGYDVVMMMMGMEIKITMWATTDVPFDWKSFSSLYSEMYKAQLRIGEKYIEEFKKINGFPVLTEVNVMGMTITTTVTEIDPNKTATPGLYSVPAGYTKTDKLSMEGMQ